MQEKSKSKLFFDSLWFNAIMSVVAMVVLVENIIEQSYILIIVWVIILIHFIVTTRKAIRERKQD